MSRDADITREVTGVHGRYVLVANGARAELTYRIAASGRIIAEHTGVPDAMRGTGAGLALVRRLVADARSEGVRIVPRCAFIDAHRRRHPDWSDIFEL
ncbi:GNAT family N-acetyltransferase [Roseivivax sp. CAU 1753]